MNKKETKHFSLIMLNKDQTAKSYVFRWGFVYSLTILTTVLLVLTSNFIFVMYPNKLKEYEMLSASGTVRLSTLLNNQLAYIKNEVRVVSQSSDWLLSALSDLETKDMQMRDKIQITPQSRTLQDAFNANPLLASASEPSIGSETKSLVVKAVTLTQRTKDRIIEFATTDQQTSNLDWFRQHTPDRYPFTDGATRNHSPGFGYRIHPILGFFEFHTGIDIEGKLGEPIYAVADGLVTKANWYGGYGLCVVIKHRADNDGIESLYGHCDELVVKEGQEVKKGELIAYVGSTGMSTGPHTHFEIRVGGHATDPDDFIQRVQINLKKVLREGSK